jgi:hypothetical protein
MGITYRTDGPWGPGLSEDLSPAQVDGNFWQLVQDITAKAVQGVGIANFVVSGTEMTVVLTDHTLLGPYELPVSNISFGGEWQPDFPYVANTVITHVGTTYMVLINHVSQATFDPYANDGMGNNYYGQLLSNPSMVIPAGGAVGWFLRKSGTADYATTWATVALEELSDVAVATPAAGDTLRYESGIWQNLPLPDALSMALSNLTDVSLTTPTAGQPLVYDGTNWIDAVTVDMPCGGLATVSGSLTLDRTAGEVQRLTLASTVTLTNIVGWPPGGRFARLVLEIQNPSTFSFAWPTGVLWPGGVVPTVTANGKDVYILISFDGGATIYGNVAGQNFM